MEILHPRALRYRRWSTDGERGCALRRTPSRGVCCGLGWCGVRTWNRLIDRYNQFFEKIPVLFISSTAVLPMYSTRRSALDTCTLSVREACQ